MEFKRDTAFLCKKEKLEQRHKIFKTQSLQLETQLKQFQLQNQSEEHKTNEKEEREKVMNF
jgi:hypothetical protein